jgi:hypothetical protein
MSKSRKPATAEGYLDKIMVHKIFRTVGVVENVDDARAGWPPQITPKLNDGALKRGKFSDFREPTHTDREQSASAQPRIHLPPERGDSSCRQKAQKAQNCVRRTRQ